MLNSHRLKAGMPAIDFEAQDINGKPISLSRYKGKKVMLSFYRYAECLFCNLQIHQLLQKQAEFDAKGLQMIAVFQSPVQDVIKAMQKHQAPFPIIANSGRDLYKRYGVEEHSPAGFAKSLLKVGKTMRAFKNGYFVKVGKGSKTLIPADFLIDETGIIRTAFYANDISGHISMDEIMRFLEG